MPKAKFYRAIQRVQKASDQHYADRGEQVYPIFSMEDDAICHGLSSQRLTSKNNLRVSEFKGSRWQSRAAGTALAKVCDGRRTSRDCHPSELPRSLIDDADDHQRCEESRNDDRGNQPRCQGSSALVAHYVGEGLGSPALVIPARNSCGVVARICLGISSRLGHSLQVGYMASNDQGGSRTRAGYPATSTILLTRIDR
jgi:hypothetical protein